MDVPMTTPAREFKDDVYAHLARLGHAFSSPKRLELLDVLCQGPRTVEALAAATAMNVPNASQHLKALLSARLVRARKSGLFVTYQVAGPEVAALFVHLREVAAVQLPDLRDRQHTFVQQHHPLDAVAPPELVQRAFLGRCVVLDVRPAEEFAAGHLPGARSVPLGLLDATLADLPRGEPIVAYCRGPYCVFAMEAVSRLRTAGFSAWRLEQGPPEWQAAGVPLACAS
jgi:rhodanese-related sulfurtransferase/DNA-binding transcriptional ArsR family regulator